MVDIDDGDADEWRWQRMMNDGPSIVMMIDDDERLDGDDFWW